MNNPTIEQKKEAIATYMELDKYQGFDDKFTMWQRKENRLKRYFTDQLQYNTSWDWLMPVIEKISKTALLEADGTPCIDFSDVCYPRTFGMPTLLSKDKIGYMFRFNGYACHEADTLIEAAFEAVYDFIFFENQRKNFI